MKTARVWLTLLLANGTVWAQQYVISTVAGGALPSTPINGLNASIGSPSGVAIDSAGNVYFSSGTVSSVFRLDSNGIMTRVAGNGRAGYAGDGGPATSAQLNQPDGLAVDPGGNLYITEYCSIRKVSAGGIITIVAGNGSCGFYTSGTQAAFRPLESPTGPTLDSSGNLFFADYNGSFVARVSPSGVITMVAGNTKRGYGGDGGAAASAQLSFPSGVAVDVFGNVFISDSGNSRIRKVSPAGTITTIAGNGSFGYSGDGGPAVNAQLNVPSGIAIDSANNLYIT